MLTTGLEGLKVKKSLDIKTGEELKCPHCLALQGDIVDDCVHPGVSGFKSRQVAECFECFAEFHVERTSATSFIVF